MVDQHTQNEIFRTFNTDFTLHNTKYHKICGVVFSENADC